MGTQHSMRMCYILMCGMTGTNTVFSTLFYKRHDFLINILSNTELSLISSTTFYLEHFSLYEELSQIR